MPNLINAAIAEIPKFLDGLILLSLVWLVGNKISATWNIRQKRKEHDLETARDFHILYGEFFATWKLWNFNVEGAGADFIPSASRWELLDRACKAEGKLEATLVRLTCDKNLETNDISVLGDFRQLYQELREHIEDNKILPWSWSEHPHYVMLKDLAPKVHILINRQSRRRMTPAIASANLRRITANDPAERLGQLGG